METTKLLENLKILVVAIRGKIEKLKKQNLKLYYFEVDGTNICLCQNCNELCKNSIYFFIESLSINHIMYMHQ